MVNKMFRSLFHLPTLTPCDWIRPSLKAVTLLGLSCSVLINSVHAETLTAKLTFDKKPPKAGVLFIPGEGEAIKAELNQSDKKFSSKLVVVSPNGSLTFKNSDSLDHNIFANDVKKGVKFDVGLMPERAEITQEVDWSTDMLVRVGCKIHPTMKAYVANIQAKVYEALEFEKKVKEYDYTLENVAIREWEDRSQIGHGKV